MNQVNKTDEEWRQELSESAYCVLPSLEQSHHSLENTTLALGTYVCAGCGNPLYRSDTKYDSGSGWPEFLFLIDDAVEYHTDTKLLVPRTEVTCAKCGGHLGHVFNDGPFTNG